MSFKSQIIWSFFFIPVLHWPTEMTDAAELPNEKDYVQYIYEFCLTNVIIGNDYVVQWFPENLSYGERMEEFCRGINVSNAEEKLAKYSRKDKKIGEEIKKCIRISGHTDIYNKFYEFGDKEFTNFQQQQNNEKTLSDPQISLKFNLGKAPKDDNLATINPEDEANRIDMLNFSKFILGMCHRDTPINLNQLQDETEKRVTNHCLHSCVSVFIKRIDSILDDRRCEIMKRLRRDGFTKIRLHTNGLNRDLYPVEFKFLTHEEDLDKIEESARGFRFSWGLDLSTIREKMKYFLANYSTVYSRQNEYLTEKNINYKPSIPAAVENNEEITVDYLLSLSFRLCKSCAKRECYMKKSNIPIYQYIYDVAHDIGVTTTTTDLSSVSSTSTNEEPSITETSIDDTTMSPRIEFHVSERKFFEVLISDDRNDDDNLFN